MSKRNPQVRTDNTRIHVTPWLVTHFPVAMKHGKPGMLMNANSSVGTAITIKTTAGAVPPTRRRFAVTNNSAKAAKKLLVPRPKFG